MDQDSIAMQEDEPSEPDSRAVHPYGIIQPLVETWSYQRATAMEQMTFPFDTGIPLSRAARFSRAISGSGVA